eukprot:GHVH01015518.1.p1 GENE.GHVH01015518.1~~GHVH01015518.1.p1  ORF type:complete len:584 (+),score=73.60 GHVH01015518.1:694-2445(+)
MRFADDGSKQNGSAVSLATPILVKRRNDRFNVFTVGAILPRILTPERPELKILLLDRSDPPSIRAQTAIALPIERVMGFLRPGSNQTYPIQMICPCDRHNSPEHFEFRSAPRELEAAPAFQETMIGNATLTNYLWHFCDYSLFIFLIYENQIGLLVSVDILSEEIGESESWRIEAHTCCDGVRVAQSVANLLPERPLNVADQLLLLANDTALIPGTLPPGELVQISTMKRLAAPFEWLFMMHEDRDGDTLIAPLQCPVEELVVLMKSLEGHHELIRVPVAMLIDCVSDRFDREDLRSLTFCKVQSSSKALAGFSLPDLSMKECTQTSNPIIYIYTTKGHIEFHKYPERFKPLDLPTILLPIVRKVRMQADKIQSPSTASQSYFNVAAKLFKSVGSTVAQVAGIGDIMTKHIGGHGLPMSRLRGSSDSLDGIIMDGSSTLLLDGDSSRFHVFMGGRVSTRDHFTPQVPILHCVHSSQSMYRNCSLFTCGGFKESKNIVIHDANRGVVEVWSYKTTVGGPFLELDATKSLMLKTALVGDALVKIPRLAVNPQWTFEEGESIDEQLILVGRRRGQPELQEVLAVIM